MLAFVGAQRTGKTTLAKAFAQKNTDYTALMTSVGGVFKRLGLDPKVDYPFDKRLDTQRHILDELEAQYNGAGLLFVTDRSPVDMIAYTLADVQRETLTDPLEKALEEYVNDCFEVTNRYFATLMIVQPGIEPEESEKSAPATYGYTEHINALCIGLTMDSRLKCAHFALNRTTTDLDRRVAAVENMLSVCRQRTEAQRGDLVCH